MDLDFSFLKEMFNRMSKLYSYKTIKYGFVVLCPYVNFYQIKNTINSIKSGYADQKFICILPASANKDKSIVETINKICPTIISSDNSMLSLMNEGMKAAPSKEWNFIIRSGSLIKGQLDKKYSYYIESEKDILYPFIKGKNNFSDGCSNGIMIHKKAIDEIGPISSIESFDYNKLVWANRATELGYKFKAIFGINFI